MEIKTSFQEPNREIGDENKAATIVPLFNFF